MDRYKTVAINFLHVINDGFEASLLLFLPFITNELHLGLTQVGFLGSTMNVLKVFLALPVGYVASRYGGFRLLIIAILFYAIGHLFVSIGQYYYVIAFGFLIAGIGFAIFHPISFSVVVKMFDKKERGSRLGTFTAIGDIGRIGMSSIITFVIAYIGWRSTALSCFAVLSVLFIIYFVGFFRRKTTIIIDQHNSKGISYRGILKNKKFILSTLSYCLDTFASSALFVFIPFLLLSRNVSPALLGSVTSTFFFGNMFGKVLLGRLVDKFGNTNVFILSEISMAFFIVILSNSTLLPLIIVASIILGIFTKGTIPVLTTMISESVEDHGRFEKAFGLNALITGVAATLAPLALGYFADKWGIVTAFNLSASFALMAIIPAYIFKTLKS